MSMGTDCRAEARTALAAQIETIGREFAHMTPVRFAFAIDDIRRDARRHRFESVAALASGLERAMATSGGSAVVLPFLEAMGDAVDCDDDQPASTRAWLGSVGARLYG